ncbi:hypothetical protein [Halocella sp. SP3-1]|uniref:protein kinase domain-containing protein n=1 Tax=Halocella sp. SP3-1 TaxID=2382161 RepID=UPI000F757376|nr:hypothetical protein [Halocella sp. SP3-1]AZO93862.1 hypothetical protein D7D81_04240 [Halocella sp. SP3-1]
MRIVNEVERWGKRFYELTDGQESSVAEAIFVTRKPRSRIMLDVKMGLEDIISKGNLLQHEAFIKYKSISMINDEYCLLKDEPGIYQPLTAYLREKSPSLVQRVKWVLTLAEVLKEAEEKGCNWTILGLKSLQVDKDGGLKVIDPAITGLTWQYREDEQQTYPEEVYQAVEVYKEKKWAEGSHIYNAGVIMYYLLTDRMPFNADDKSDLVDQIYNSIPVDPRYLSYQLSKPLNDFIMSTLKKDLSERLGDWDSFISQLRNLEEKGLLEGDLNQLKENQEKASQMIKKRKHRLSVRNFWRKKRAVITVVGGLLAFFVLLGFMGGSREPVVTEETTPSEVVEIFYQGIDQKDIFLVEDTNISDLGELDNLLNRNYVIERVRQAYSMADTEGFFGITDLEITKLADHLQPVFEVVYHLYINNPTDETNEDTGEPVMEKIIIDMKDRVLLGNVEGRWQIVELEGSIQSLIQGELALES